MQQIVLEESLHSSLFSGVAFPDAEQVQASMTQDDYHHLVLPVAQLAIHGHCRVHVLRRCRRHKNKK